MGKHPDRLAVSVPEEQKEKWENFEAQTDAYNSMSDLVRTAVENEIGLDERTRQFAEMKEELVSIFSSLDVKLDNVDDNVSEMKGKIPSDEVLYNINHDANVDAIDLLIEDADASTDHYKR